MTESSAASDPSDQVDASAESAEPPLPRLPDPRAERDGLELNVVAIASPRRVRSQTRIPPDEGWLRFADGVARSLEAMAQSLRRVEEILSSNEREQGRSLLEADHGYVSPQGHRQIQLSQTAARVYQALGVAGAAGATPAEICIDVGLDLGDAIKSMEVLARAGQLYGPEFTSGTGIPELRRYWLAVPKAEAETR